MQMLKNFLLIAFVFSISACNLAPKHHAKIPLPMPKEYLEAGKWMQFQPHVSLHSKKPWWELFNDPCLTHLEQELSLYNFDLKIALSRYDESLALLQMSKSKLYPHLFLENYLSRQQNSITLVENNPPYIYSNVMLDTVLNYQVDAWGSIRNTVAATRHFARATQYDLAAIDLNLHTTLAKLYFQLEAFDAQQKILNELVKVFQKNWWLVKKLHKIGLVSAFEIDTAKELLGQAITDATNLKIIRAQTQHAIAVLIGKNPSIFVIKSTHYPFQIPQIDTDLPSQLMTQRPDLAAHAERVKSANATIGVARAAFLPVISINAMIGYNANTYNNILSAPNLLWSLGPRSVSGAHLPPALFSQVIFDGFNLLGHLNNAKATYRQIVSEYRKNVLTAFQQVEDRLVAIHRLEQEEKSFNMLTQASHDAYHKAIIGEELGMYSAIQIVRYQMNYLNNESKLIQIRLARQIETIGLVDALGGGWQKICKLKTCTSIKKRK